MLLDELLADVSGRAYPVLGWLVKNVDDVEFLGVLLLQVFKLLAHEDIVFVHVGVD